MHLAEFLTGNAVFAQCACERSVSGKTTANSSPPKRPTRSVLRTHCASVAPTNFSTKSPSVWPKESSTALKRLQFSKTCALLVVGIKPHHHPETRIPVCPEDIAETRKKMSAAKRTGIVRDPRYADHCPGPDHPECSERQTVLHDMLNEPDMLGHFEQITPRPAEKEELRL
jgi:hypothetical protein